MEDMCVCVMKRGERRERGGGSSPPVVGHAYNVASREGELVVVAGFKIVEHFGITLQVRRGDETRQPQDASAALPTLVRLGGAAGPRMSPRLG